MACPQLPEIFPPTNMFRVPTNKIMSTDSDADDEYPDHIYIPESDDGADSGDSLSLPDSDSSEICFPVSDEESSDARNVVRSDEAANSDMPMCSSESESSIPDHIVLPESPMTTSRSISGSGMLEHGANTGRFTGVSFANFPDDFLD